MIKRTLLLRFLVLFTLASASGISQDTRENADLKLAIGLYNDGLFGQAEDQFKRFIDKFPNTASGIEARFYLGLVQQKLKKYHDARSTFQDFALRYQDHSKAPDALWNLGELYAVEHNYPEAASAFARLKTFHPKSARAPAALLEASKYFEKAGDMENATLVLNSLLVEYPQSDVLLPATYALARLFMEAGSYDRALSELRRVQNSTANPVLRAKATVAIGEVQALLGNNAEAELRFREVIMQAANTPAAYEAQLRLADMQRANGQNADATAGYDAVMKNTAAPAEVRIEAYAGAAENAIAADRSADAVRIYASLFAAFPDQSFEPSIFRRAARASEQAADHAGAAKYLDRIYADTLLSIDKRGILVDLARNERKASLFNAAIRHYQEYGQRYPDDAGAPQAQLETAGIFETEYGNLSRASELYRGLLERHPNSAVADRAQLGLARALEAQEKWADAAEAYRQVEVQYPASAFAAEAGRKREAILLSRMVVPEKALPAIVDALAALSGGGNPGADLLLGRISFEHLKRYEDAMKFFGSALAKNVQGEEAEEAAFGKAASAARLVRLGKGNRAEAEQLLEAFLQAHASGKRRDDALYELYLLQSDGAAMPVVADAASKFLARNPGSNLEQVQLDFAEALLASGRAADAEKQCAQMLGSTRGARWAEALHFRGMARALQQNYTGAAEDFRAYAKESPNGVHAGEALLMLGRVLDRVGQYPEALSSYEALVQRFPYSPLADSARIALLSTLAETDQAAHAAARAEEFLRQARANPFNSGGLVSDYLYAASVAAAKAKDVPAAKKSLQQYAAEFPRGRHIDDVYYALGHIFKEEGKTSLAASYLKRTGNAALSQRARLEAADLALDAGRFDDAVREYDALATPAASRMDRSYALSRAVVALYRAGKVTDADKRAADFRAEFSDAEPVFEEFELERGKHLFRQKLYDKAEDVFDDLSDSDSPGVASMASFWMAKVDEAQSRNTEAEEGFNKVVKKHPGTAAAVEASLALARMAMRAEKYDAAALNLKTVIDAPSLSQATLKEALNSLIVCYEELHIFDAAVEMTKRYLDAYPNDPTAFRKRVNLGVYYYQLGYFQQAVLHFENLLPQASSDDQAEIRYYIGESYYYKGDYTQAALEFLKVPYLVVRKTEIDWTASAYYMAGQSYEKQSKFQLAIDMYQKIVTTPGLDARFKAQAQKEIERVQSLIR